jgi:hypothetical protein
MLLDLTAFLPPLIGSAPKLALARRRTNTKPEILLIIGVTEYSRCRFSGKREICARRGSFQPPLVASHVRDAVCLTCRLSKFQVYGQSHTGRPRSAYQRTLHIVSDQRLDAKTPAKRIATAALIARVFVFLLTLRVASPGLEAVRCRV